MLLHPRKLLLSARDLAVPNILPGLNPPYAKVVTGVSQSEKLRHCESILSSYSKPGLRESGCDLHVSVPLPVDGGHVSAPGLNNAR
jgi:hypothetical protein